MRPVEPFVCSDWKLAKLSLTAWVRTEPAF
jgi:hypothetical protein